MAERRIICGEGDIEIYDVDVLYTALWQAEMLGMSVKELSEVLDLAEVKKIEDFGEAVAAYFSLCVLVMEHSK